MGIRRNSEGKYCQKLFCQFSNVVFAWLLYLLLMAGICACDLKKEQKPVEQPAPQVQKMPLPQRGAQPPPETAVKAPAEKKEAVPVSKPASPVGAPVARPAPKPVPPAGPPVAKHKPAPKPALPAGPAVAKTALKSAPKPAETGKKVEVVPANGKKPLPSHGDIKERKPAVAAKTEPKDIRQVKKSQPIAADKKNVPVSDNTRLKATKQQKREKTLETSATKKTRPTPAKASGRNWTVVAGPYLLEEDLANDLAKAGKAGLSASVQQGARRKASMHRLLLGQFDDRATAGTELEKLNKLTSDGFILDRGGKHSVYAGSYLLSSRAQSEKKRLAAAGVALTITKTEVGIPSKNLIAGAFRDKAAAEAAARKMRNAGLKNVQVRQ